MKAITLKKVGGIENLMFSEVSIPSIGQNEVLVKVKSIAINPVDAFVRQNDWALSNYLQPKNGEDIILGWDVSGTVVEAGENVSHFKPGDDVFGMVNFLGHGKAYAEYIAAPANHLAIKPAAISHDEAAAATLAALTAWQALVTYAKVREGEKIVIHAAAGGVGHYSVQIAKYFGAHVIAVASERNRAFLAELGADEFIDYSKEKFEEKVQNADIVIDSIYGDHILRSIDAAKRGGRVISLLTPVEGVILDKAKDKDVNAQKISVTSDGEDMRQLALLLENGRLKSHVSKVFSFDDLRKAHQQIETRRTVGKIVVSLQ